MSTYKFKIACKLLLFYFLSYFILNITTYVFYNDCMCCKLNKREIERRRKKSIKEICNLPLRLAAIPVLQYHIF